MQPEFTKIPPAKLAFDIDGVFADTFRVFIKKAWNEYGIQIVYEDITEYDFRTLIDIDDEISKKILESLLDNPLEIGIKPISGAVDVLRRLSRIGPLLFVTARPKRGAILEWVQEYLQVVDMNIIRLEATGSQDEKLPVLMKYGVEYFVEDNLETCYLLNQHCVEPIVFEQPWNRKPHPFRAVKDWEELSGMIEW